MQTGLHGRTDGSTLAKYAGKFKSDIELQVDAHKNAAIPSDVLFSLLLLVNYMRDIAVF